MKVKVNSGLIKSSRLNRAWSQEQLAHLTGLSLRTIHRVEAKGTAALESIKAIASVLELPLEQIMQSSKEQKEPIRSKLTKNGVIASFGALVFAMLSIFVGNTVLAEQVMFDVDFLVNDEVIGEISDLPVEYGEEGVFVFDDIVKILLVASITETDDILVSTEILEFDGVDYALVSKPKALFKKDGDGAIQITSEAGITYRVSISAKTE